MNQRIFAVLMVMGLVLASSDAFASRARVLVMGTGESGAAISDGSLYYDEAYNMFYNPAMVNNHKNWAIFEKSNFPGTSAMAGMVSEFGMVNLGLFFNRVAGTHELMNTRATMRPIDLILGTEVAGWKLGLGLTYGNFKGNNTSFTGAGGNASGTIYSHDLTGRVGAEYMGFEPFVSFTFSAKQKVPTTDATTGLPIANETQFKHFGGGLRYRWGEWTPYAAIYTDKAQATRHSYVNPLTSSLATAGFENKNTNWGLGIGRSFQVAPSVKMNYAVSFWSTKNTNTHPDLTSILNKETTSKVVPLDVSVEASAADWITLRGGLNYRLWNGVVGTSTDSTSGRIGGTFHVGKVDVNFAVGTNTNGTGAATAEAAGSTNGQQFGLSDNFFTAASVQYSW